MKITFRIITLLILFSSFDVNARGWTDVTGREISADYVSQTESSVILRLSGNGNEVTVPKERLSPSDLAFLQEMAAGKAARFFPVNTSERATSPWYYVAESDALFRPVESQKGSWVLDKGRSSDEPPPVSFPVIVNKGVQRFVNTQSKERIIIFGAEDFGLLKQVNELALFSKLRIQEKRSLMAVLSAAFLEHGKASRAAVSELLGGSSFGAMDPRAQSEEFLKVVEKSSPNLDRNFNLTNFQPAKTNERWRKVSRYTTFQIEEPVEAWENEVRVDGVGGVKVFSLREDDSVGLHAIAKGLSCLPPEMVEYLEIVSLHYQGEGFWWGGGSKIYYVAPRDLKFDGPLVYVMAHEVGHCIQAQKVRGWNEALQDCIVFPSAYGLTNINEDFAEFAAIVTRAWTNPEEMIEIEEVVPWRHEIYTKALGYKRSKSRKSTAKPERKDKSSGTGGVARKMFSFSPSSG